MPVRLTRPVDWVLIAEGVEFYRKLGYVPVETPWIVSPIYTRATAPDWAVPLATPEGDLVGSGEQGLLSLAATGQLEPGRYMTTTPCFRDDRPDDLHGRHFVKVELMWLGSDVGEAERDTLVSHARSFFSQYLEVEEEPIDTEPGQIDLVCRRTRLELGSYGIRQWGSVRWAYGTGVAEPRLSTVLSYR